MTEIRYRKAKELVTFRTGKLDSNAAEESGRYPFFTCAQETYLINKYAFDTECVLLAGNNAGGIFPLKFYRGKFNAYQRTYIIESRDSRSLNIKYFYFFLRPLLKAFEQQAIGATTKFLTLKILNNIQVALPDVESQKKISAILSAYDELIDNNQRRIALLENMAEEIYREWFVRLRFPGHENVKNVKGIPEGWEIDRVDSIGKIVTGKTPSTDNPRYFGGPYFFIKTPDMHGNIFIVETEERLSQNGLDSQPSQTISRGSICVSCIGTGGIVSITTSECQTNQQINSVIVRNPSDLEWAFFSLRNLREAIQMFGATGATMTNLSKGKFSSLKILRPNKSIVLKYHALVNPIFAQMQSILQQTMILRSTRDLLLPRLISGKLSVEHLDIQLPPGMEESAHVN